MEKRVDVAIIGAGSAGLTATGRVRRKTDSFVLINGGELGTTCARVGCMPSKAAIQVAEDFHRRTLFDREGIEGESELSVNFEDALEHVRDLRDIFVDQVLMTSTDNMGEELIEGHARFLEPDLLQIDDGQRIRAKRVIIATGSHPIVPEGWAAFRDRILTTDELFEQESLPESMVVVGLGIVGLELGQALHRMGIKLTGIDQLNTIGGLSDPVVNQTAIEIIGKEMPLWLGAPATIVQEGDRLRVSAGDRSVLVDGVLAAMGRRPNVAGLGLENLGAPLDERGVPVHDPHTMQIGNLPVFIAGDVTGDRAILHEANDEGRIAGHNAVRETPEAFERKTPLAINFCDPNICMVGASWDQLDEERIAVGEMKMAGLGRAIIMGKNKGLIRVYADKEDGRVLGAAMVATKSEHLAHLLAWGIQQGMTVFDMLRMPFYHPALEEGLQSALYGLRRQIIHQPEDPIELRRRSSS